MPVERRDPQNFGPYDPSSPVSLKTLSETKMSAPRASDVNVWISSVITVEERINMKRNLFKNLAELNKVLKSRMREICKYGSERGLPFSNLGKR